MPRNQSTSESKSDASQTAVASSGKKVGRAKPHSADIIDLPIHVRPRALELLAAQPVSLAGLSQAERDLVVVTAVADEHGNEYPVSRIGDPEWHLASESQVKNRKGFDHIIVWPDDVSSALVYDAKAVLYCALRRGPHGKPWSASTVQRVGGELRSLFIRLEAMGVRDFGELRALHLSDYITELKRTIKPNSIRHKLAIVDLVWNFPSETLHSLSEHPWGGETFPDACGCNDDDASGPVGRTGKTPVIPRSTQRILFEHCESCLLEADALFEARDAGKISASSYSLTAVRDAVLYLTQVTSGMRNSESTGISNGCWRSEVRNGVAFHWVRTLEIKTDKGIVDYLVPPEAIHALGLLQRYAEPLQARLADESRWLEVQLQSRANEGGLLANGMNTAEAVGRLNHVREISQHVFLALDAYHSDHLGTGSRVEVMSLNACNAQLKSLARAAGSDWSLSNQQCRRTFAYNVANSRLGRMGLVFLKWQLKHASISCTELYASNPYQDASLYRELEEEQTAARVELMEGWMLSDVPLSGGAGRKLIQTRATPVRNLKDLLLHAAEAVEIRHTGHAWCLSGTKVCHGQGVYEPANCAGCSQAVIDSSQAATWQMIHLENLRLAAITDCGPAVIQKARRATLRSEEVLRDLRVGLPSKEQADAYEKAGLCNEDN
ncbi:integrase [Paraburkholderia agricolaris]|uniref:Integrase n=1 Tax=Paraburkholderia agricolaris TaxID=2152888 RepID=A0ABW8ZJ24_9BURK